MGFCSDPAVGFCSDPAVGFCSDAAVGFCSDPAVGFTQAAVPLVLGILLDVQLVHVSEAGH